MSIALCQDRCRVRSPQSHSPRPSWCSSPGAVARYTNPFPGADIGDIADQPVSRTFGGGIPHRSRSGREPQHDRRDDGADLAAGLCGLQALGAHGRVRTASRFTTTPLLARGLLVACRSAAPVGHHASARAGFTRCCLCWWWMSGDHPRSRGVYGGYIIRGLQGEGSSPLARGLLRRGAPASARRGIIPARAGFTQPSAHRPGQGPDHPRSRGVYVRDGPLETVAGGSSPLARGLPPVDPRPEGGRRIIPARAGFTKGL